ncbi:MAG: hypothetical protein WC447_01090 [Candidatus Paceibacterota bacterium]|jgi:hypothetical protein
MRQASLKLKNYASNVNIIDNGNLNRRVLNVMLGTLFVIALLYFFFLASMVFNIVERKTLEGYALTLSNEVGNLEQEYLSLSQKVDLNLAYSLGFKEIKATFVTRKALGSIDIAKNEI